MFYAAQALVPFLQATATQERSFRLRSAHVPFDSAQPTFLERSRKERL
jgi:hypothetical protein